MNETTEDERPQEISFDAPDVSHLYIRSEELAAQAREVNDQMTMIIRRMHEAVRISNEHLRKSRQILSSIDNGQTQASPVTETSSDT